MKNSDTSQLGLIYENIVLMKGPIGSMGGFDMPKFDVEDDDQFDDDHNPEESDPSEIHMALAELKKLSEYADKLYDKINDLDGLEGWVASKITKASDYISSVYHWIDYEQDEVYGDSDDYEDEGCGCDEDEECKY